MFLIRFLYRIQNKYKGIPDLMRYIVIVSAAVYVLGYLGIRTADLLCLVPSKVLDGQIWRILTFIFLMPAGSILFAAFAFYFYYIVGQALEHEWGSFCFTVYYACNVLFTILIALLSDTTVSSAAAINLSLFLAFGYSFPEYTIYLFMFIPIKMKYLAVIYGIYAVYQAIVLPGWGAKLIALSGCITFAVFFYEDLFCQIRQLILRHKSRDRFRRTGMYSGDHLRVIRHQCEVCKRTELDDPNLEFRYCSACDGYHEYCIDHLGTHQHIKADDSGSSQ